MQKFALIFISISIWCCSTTRKYDSSIPTLQQNQEDIDSINAYKIVKIDSVESVFTIYAKKGDSIFKIASKKVEEYCATKIQVDKFYELTIHSVFPENYYQKNDIAGVNFNNVVIRLGEKGVVWDLFVSENLKGLCYENSHLPQKMSTTGSF